MKLKTISAPSMAEAMKKAKAEVGSDAVILHSRTVTTRKWMGLRTQEMIEITVGSGSEIGAARVAQQRERARAAAAVVRNNPAPRPRGAAAPAPRPGVPGKDLLNTPAAQNAVVSSMTQEMEQIKHMIKELVESQRRSSAPQVAEELFDHYLKLLQNQVADELAREVMKAIQASVRAEHFKNPDFIRDKIAEHLERLIPIAGPVTRTKASGPHIVALIGPTGVGKTTTVAKLAANLKLREGHKVGLVTIDTYRIAAVDQLRKYAEIIGSPLRVVSSPDELRDAMTAMNDLDFILIDTAGRAPGDALKLSELRSFLTSARPDEVHLVLSTTASEECIEEAVRRFSEVRVDKIIFTKLDEAVHVGVMLNVARKLGKSLSYITTGQDVPDDIEVGRGRRLAQLILGSSL